MFVWDLHIHILLDKSRSLLKTNKYCDLKYVTAILKVFCIMQPNQTDQWHREDVSLDSLISSASSVTDSEQQVLRERVQ